LSDLLGFMRLKQAIWSGCCCAIESVYCYFRLEKAKNVKRSLYQESVFDHLTSIDWCILSIHNFKQKSREM